MDAAQAVHKFVGMAEHERALDVFIRNIRVYAHVIGDGAREEKHILQHHGDLRAQAGERPFLDGHAVDQNLAPLRRVEPRKQVDHRGFARAGRAHKGQFFARFRGEGKPLEHPFFAHVGEPHIPEFHAAHDLRLVAGRVEVFQRAPIVEQAEDAVGGDHGRLHGIVFFRQVVDGFEELLDVSCEGE